MADDKKDSGGDGGNKAGDGDKKPIRDMGNTEQRGSKGSDSTDRKETTTLNR